MGERIPPWLQRVVVWLTGTVLIGLGGWVYATSERVTRVEVRQQQGEVLLKEVRDDVKELLRRK